MYLVVYGLRNAGLADQLASLLDVFARSGVWGAALGTGFLAAMLSSVMNNMPTVLIGALSIDASGATGVVKDAMIYANVIGCDLGPTITPIGGLATLLWLHAVEEGHHDRLGCVRRGRHRADRAGPGRHPGRARDPAERGLSQIPIHNSETT